ncbi:UNVERIFIED_CONTAM: hypothetical protein GTU68_049337 [Idotea baltica]|nr:hypothetical protein [Idotea baltica]
MDNPTCQARGFNPLCGDQITLFLKVKDGLIEDISFDASGCAISVASASLMSDLLKGQKVSDAQVMFDKFHEMLTEGKDGCSSLGDLEALAGVRQFPIRIKCATLAWHALKEGLEKV